MKIPAFDELKNFLFTKDVELPTFIKTSDTEFIVSYTNDSSFEIKHSESDLQEERLSEIDEEIETEMALIEDETQDFTAGDDIEPIEVSKNSNTNFEVLSEQPKSGTLLLYQPANENKKRRNINTSTSSANKLSQCKTCNIDIKDVKFCDIHKKSHENFYAISSFIQIYFKCNVDHCRMVFSKESDLKAHSENHTNGIHGCLLPRNGAYDDIFIKSDQSELDDSIENLDELEVCGHCNRKFEENEMKVHMIFFHIESINCPFDSRTFEGFKQVRLFSEHIRNKHPEIFADQFLYKCTLCSATFTSNFEKLAHMKLCDAKTFKCTGHCSKRFATEWHLKTHLKNLEDDRFSCEMCGKKSISKSDLDIHLRSHTNVRMKAYFQI